MRFKIAVCGFPLVGKTALMTNLSKLLSETQGAQVECVPTTSLGVSLGYIMKISGKFETREFYWFSGSSADFQAAYRWLLQDVNAVIYVFSSSQNPENQIRHFRRHLAVATEFCCTPPGIPWLYALNIFKKMPHRYMNPFPEEVTTTAIELDARYSRGLDTLWSELLKL